ncbi:MAG: arylesterase [Chromatiaceae bacterium]
MMPLPLIAMLPLLLAVAPVASGDEPDGSPAPPIPRLLVLGDSLSAAYGIASEDGWVSLLQERLRDRGARYEVVNASISGETTAGGLTRLPTLLAEHQPQILVIALGANDGLRGFSFDTIRRNLGGMIQRARESGSRVILAGVRLPPNYGAAYTQGFQAVFRELAGAEGVPLVPEILAGVAEDRGLMQADGIHPTAAAQPLILDNVWPVLQPLLAGESLDRAIARQRLPRER